MVTEVEIASVDVFVFTASVVESCVSIEALILSSSASSEVFVNPLSISIEAPHLTSLATHPSLEVDVDVSKFCFVSNVEVALDKGGSMSWFSFGAFVLVKVGLDVALCKVEVSQGDEPGGHEGELFSMITQVIPSPVKS